MTHYSPYKVAENFRLLENMYPGRIDLGIGRAPGGVPLTSLALADGDRRGSRDFPRKVRDLISYLTDSLSPEHPYAGVQATPVSENVPGIYLLGSSDGSATLAADMGTPFMFAHFINPHGGEAVTRQYRLRYQPSALYPEPSAAVCIFVVVRRRMRKPSARPPHFGTGC
ncbi:MsnO8 family LLM class oxidoreductase [Terrilactibacillus sp. S3-3]|nr:MsnO8 family LLM class oxidoreductase [Terrilactibacillus sp. S3-3]